MNLVNDQISEKYSCVLDASAIPPDPLSLDVSTLPLELMTLNKSIFFG